MNFYQFEWNNKKFTEIQKEKIKKIELKKDKEKNCERKFCENLLEICGILVSVKNF